MSQQTQNRSPPLGMIEIGKKGEGGNPKSLLGSHAVQSRPVSAEEAAEIVESIRNLDILRERCPSSFAPFADEVERHIRPLFLDTTDGSDE